MNPVKISEFKKTKLGFIPMDWAVSKIGDHVNLLSGHAFKSKNYSDTNSGIKLLRGDNIMQGYFRWKGVKYWDKNIPENLCKYLLEENDLVIAMDRTWVSKGLKVAVVHNKDLPCLLVQRVSRLRAKAELEQRILRYYFSSHRFEQYVKSVQKESAVPHISSRQIKNYQIPLPPISEQQKIATILSSWDNAIDLIQQLIAAKEEQKKGLMQRLLTGKVRVSENNKQWNKKRVKELFSLISDKNDGEKHPVLTISARLGLVSQKKKFDRVIAGNSLAKYTLLRNSDFAYNKGNSKLYEMGCIYQLREYETALVPFVYICFRPKENIHPEFYRHWFLAHGLDRQLKRIITSGARGDGLLNVNKHDFMNLLVPYPAIDEQEQIGTILSKADEEIKILTKKLDELKKQKKGLMQRLLTGKIRVINN